MCLERRGICGDPFEDRGEDPEIKRGLGDEPVERSYDATDSRAKEYAKATDEE